jgi:hypothetical protein
MPNPCAKHENISGIRSLVAIIFTLVTNEAFKCLNSFTPRQGRNISLRRSLRGPQRGSGRFGEELNLLLLMGISSSDTLSVTKPLYHLSYPGFLFYSKSFY